MNIKQLHYFYELAQHRHFAKAAKACFITQPTLSASITALEKSLGTELVVRNSQFVALTQAGKWCCTTPSGCCRSRMPCAKSSASFGAGCRGATHRRRAPVEHRHHAAA